MAMKRLAAFTVLALVVTMANAQSDLGLPFFGDVFQSTYLNPTARAEHTLSIGFPMLSSLSVQAIHNGFVPNSVAYWDDQDTLVIDPKLLPGVLKEQSMVFAHAGIELLHVRFKVHNWDFWFAARQVHDVSFFYPKDIFAFAIEGNAPKIGDRINFTPLGLNASVYREHTIGVSTETDHWIFGGRLSLLQGIANAYLKSVDFSLSIEDDMYAHTFNADVTLKTTGLPVDFIESEDSDLLTPEFNLDKFKDTNYLIEYFTRFRNPGFALSGGVAYKLDKRTTFTFSFSDVGFISWSDSTKHYNIKGDFTFDGIDALTDYLNNNQINVDTLVNEVLSSFDDNAYSGSYTTWLPPKFYLTAQYKLAEKTQLGLQLYTVVNRKVYPAFTAGISQGFGRYFNLMLSASYNQRTISNLGFGLVLKPGPVQIYMMADNYLTPLVDPLTFTNLNFRFGINLVFGRVKTPQGLPYR
jgi:hypothetical protein